MNIKSLLLFICILISQRAFSEGLVFKCPEERIKSIQVRIENYLNVLSIPSTAYTKSNTKNTLKFNLNNNGDTSTLYLKWNPEYGIEDEIINLPTGSGEKQVKTVSKKEIVLALMNTGRTTIFSGNSCQFEAFEDHVKVRQMIVAWAEHLHWKFPDGEKAKWNEIYWKDGTLKPGQPLLEAMTDFFINEDKCSIGCYTATKVVIIQGVLDYYQRIKNDQNTAQQIKKVLRADGEVLTDIESRSMWLPLDSKRSESLPSTNGKLLKVVKDVSPRNFVPGDWVYFVNTDKDSSNISGYEGSNSIYMGRAIFDDFYNDNGHHYFYHEKLKEIYNWQYGVFSRSRDYKKIQPLSSELLNQLSLPPHKGGMVLDTRSIPKYFGFE
jgi:Protein-glutamine gamma-glutamyltransferase